MIKELTATIRKQADKIAELESSMTCMHEGHRQQIEDADTQIFTAQQRIQQLEARVKELEGIIAECVRLVRCGQPHDVERYALDTAPDSA